MNTLRRFRVPLIILGVGALVFSTSRLIPLIAHAASTDVSDCPTTPVSGLVTISQDFTSSATTCFKVGAAGVTIDGQGHTVTLTTASARLVDVTSTSTAIYNNVTVQNIHSNGDVYVNGDTADGFVIQDSTFHSLSIYSADNTQVLRNTFNSFILWGTQSLVSGNTIRGDGQRVVDIMGDGALGAPSFRGCPAVGNHTFLNNVIENTDPVYGTDAAAVTVRCSTGNIFTGNTLTGDNATSALILKDAANGNLFEQNQLSAATAAAGVIAFGDSSVYVADPAMNTFRNNTVTGLTAPAVTELYTTGGNTFTTNVMTSGAPVTVTLRVDPSAGSTTPDVWDHNTLYNTATGGQGIGLSTGTDATYRYATHFTFTNNIVSFAGQSAYAFVGPIDWTGVMLSNNLYHDRTGVLSFGAYDFNADGIAESISSLASWQTSTGSDLNSKIGDPLFVNVTLNDFRLQSTSPAAGAGTSGTNMGAKEALAPICTPNWQCTAWNQCSASGVQTRTCTDTNACGVTTGKPSESQACTPPDTTKPVVSVTSPTNGATLWGQQTLSAAATDNVGVVGVQFQVNGTNVGAEDLSAPYQTTWTPTTAGTYAITAIARDAASNSQTSATITVSAVAPICTPNWQCGAWSACSTSGVQTRTCTDTNACGVSTGQPATSQSCTPPDTTKPVVTLTSPTNGATVWGQQTLAATATDNVGVVGVQFKVNGVNVGVEDLTAPYQVFWTPGSAGTYTITATARDAAGNTQTSSTITVTATAPICTPNWQCGAWSACSTSGVQTRTCSDTNACGVTTGQPVTSQSCTPPDTTKPVVSVTSPTNGATLWGQQTLTATATDNVGVVGVQFQVNGVNFGAEDLSAPYQVLWTPATAGTYTITALARDAASNSQLSTAITVTATAPCTPNWQCTGWSQCSSSGSQTRLCTDINACGVTTGKPAETQQCVPPSTDTTPPTVSLTSPTGKRPVSGTVTIAAKAKDASGIAKVEFYVNGTLIATDTKASYSVSWNTRLSLNGTVVVMAKAYDPAGNTATASVTVSILNKLAAQVIRSTTKSTVSGLVNFSVTQYGGDPITKITVSKDKQVVATLPSAPNVYTWDTTQDRNLYHYITVMVEDAFGHSGKISWWIRVKN